MHPTREKLIVTTVEILDEGIEVVHVDEILGRSGISKGSMYHHFEDLQELLDEATMIRYSRVADQDIALIAGAIADSTSAKDFRDRVVALAISLTDPARTPWRFERARVLAEAGRNPRLRARLAVEQRRTLEMAGEALREGQRKGWIDPALDPIVLMMHLQSWGLGRVFNDVLDEPVDDTAWAAFLTSVIDRCIIVSD